MFACLSNRQNNLSQNFEPPGILPVSHSLTALSIAYGDSFRNVYL